MYLIDTNILSHLVQKNIKIKTKFGEFQDQIYLSSPVHSECLYGALKKESKILSYFYEVLFDDYKYIAYGKEDSIHFATVKNDLRKKGITIEDFDLMIAAQALAHNLILVTNNTKHFENIDGLKLEDWSM